MVKFCGRRNISSTLQSNFVAGAALGARYGQILWQAQHFKHLAVKFRGRCSTWSTLWSNFVASATLEARCGQISWQAQHFKYVMIVRYDQISWRAQEKRVIVTWFSRKEEKQYLFFFTARTGRYDPAFSFGAVHSLDRNVVYSCGASNIFNFSVRVRVARCTFWIVTWCIPVAPATVSIFLCVCVWRGAHFGS